MAAKTQRPNRCSKCNRIIRQSNKSGYCCGCAANEKKRDKLKKECFICKEPCSGKLLIEYRKGYCISLCTYHFNKLNLISDPKELREKIKYLKSYH